MANNLSLHEAVRTFNRDLVYDILKRDPSCANDYNLQFMTALHVACECDSSKSTRTDREHASSTAIAQMLIDFGADIEVPNGNFLGEFFGDTPLQMAARNRQIDLVRLLIEKKANVNAKNEYGDNVLYCAATIDEPNTEVLKLLLKHGADHQAIHYSVVNICEISNLSLLMDAGIKTRDIYMDIRDACSCRYYKLAKFFITHGSELDINGMFSIDSLMYYAGTFESKNMNDRAYLNLLMLILFEMDVNLDASTTDNRSALHIAAENKNYYCVKALVQHGVDVNIKNSYRESPLHVLLARTKGRLDWKSNKIAKLLIDCGARVNERSIFDRTPFTIAAQSGYINIVKLMLAKVVGINESNLRTAVKTSVLINAFREDFDEISVAIILGFEEVVDYFINIGCNDTIQSYLSLAISYRKINIIKMFLEIAVKAKEKYSVDILKVSDDENLKLASLLWVLTDISWLRRTFIECLWSIENNCEKPDKLVYLLMLCYAFDMQSDRLSSKMSPLAGIFKLGTVASKILSACHDKLDELKENKLCCGISGFDILSMNFDLLVTFLNCEKNLYEFEAFHSSLANKKDGEDYEYLLVERINLAIEKRKLLDCMKKHLNEIFKEIMLGLNYSCLPHDILSNILSHFTVRNMKIFDRRWKSKK